MGRFTVWRLYRGLPPHVGNGKAKERKHIESGPVLGTQDEEKFTI